MSANCLQPVTNVRFSVFTWCHAVCSFTGVDGTEDIYNCRGTTAPNLSQEPGDWLTINLNLPTGYSLTSFSLNNEDTSPNNAGIWIQDIAFTAFTTMTLTFVPESNTLTFFLPYRCGPALDLDESKINPAQAPARAGSAVC